MDYVTELQRAAKEMREQGHCGWPNACDDAASRIAELEKQLAGANQTIALFMGPDGEQHIDRFADAARSLMANCSE